MRGVFKRRAIAADTKAESERDRRKLIQAGFCKKSDFKFEICGI